MRSFVLTILNLNLRIAKLIELILGSVLREHAPPIEMVSKQIGMYKSNGCLVLVIYLDK